jgi:hypothetical protein
MGNNQPTIASFFLGMKLSLLVRLIFSGLALIVIFSDVHATSDLCESQLPQLKSGAVLVDIKQADEPSKGMVGGDDSNRCTGRKHLAGHGQLP